MAAVATAVITSVVGTVGWDKIVMVWTLLMVIGFAVTLTIKSGEFEGEEAAPVDGEVTE